MTVSPDMAERHGRMLARFAELSLSLAEDVHAAAAAAPEPDQKARLAEAFHRLGRSLRQTIAWEARLVRDLARDLKAAEAAAAEAGAAAVRRRQDQVRADVGRQIYSEVDLADAHAWLADLDERLEEEALYDDFTGESVEDHIARLSADLGLTGETKRDYTPRRCRPRRFPGDYVPVFRHIPGADADDEEGATEDAAGASPEAGPAEPPPIGPSPAACDHLPPEAETDAGPAPEPVPDPPPEPPPEPPPRPPDPEPYVAPWDRRPDARFPGGSGY